MNPEQKKDLDHARVLAAHGVPLFVAKAKANKTGFDLPKNWQRTQPDPTGAVVDEWEPGMALCAVMGHTIDVIDIDPRNGGNQSLEALGDTWMPRSYGRQATPSGGTHDLIAPLDVRKMGDVFDGIDVLSGTASGVGRGFVFLAPTEKPPHEGGAPVAYRWLTPPDLEPLQQQLELVGGDTTGAAVRQDVERKRRAPSPGDAAPYDGPEYADLPTSLQAMADERWQWKTDLWRAALQTAADWPDGQRDEKGRGWDVLMLDATHALAMEAVAPWSGIDEDTATAVVYDLMPEAMLAAVGDKWPRALREAASRPVEAPPWDASHVFDPVTGTFAEWPEVPHRLEDGYLIPWVAAKGLDNDWRWAGGLGWLRWDGKRWEPRNEENALEAVRVAMVRLNETALKAGVDPRTQQRLATLLSAARIRSLVGLLRGVVATDPGAFDLKPNLLNVGNGVVDLSTGQLMRHDRNLLLTKWTPTHYVPGATHPDWDKVLTSLTPEVMGWLQAKFGQAATGYTPKDDVLPVGQGEGSNGKTSLLMSLHAAMGDHMAQVPAKLLMARPSDHPTELMTLRGVRIAVIDETPEAGALNVPRLKAVVGQDLVTARPVHKDNVTWKATHTLFVMTNYTPNIAETDGGTWRRLAMVRFRKRFARDDTFKSRLADAGHPLRQAVLAWVVEGAVGWFANGREVPPNPAQIEADTRAWRTESDTVLAFLTDELAFDADTCVEANDLLNHFNEWLRDRGQRPWGVETFSARFGGHEEVTKQAVAKQRARAPEGLVSMFDGGLISSAGGERVRVWKGVRPRSGTDPEI